MFHVSVTVTDRGEGKKKEGKKKRKEELGQEETYLGNDLGKIGVLTDNSRIVATQLQGDPLHGRTSRLCDLLAGSCATGEADLVDAVVRGEQGAKALITTQRLEDTRRQDLGTQLGDLEVGVGSKRRGLRDNHVASHDTGADLAHAEKDGPVPGDNSGAHTEGTVPDDGGALGSVLDHLVWDAQGGGDAEVADGELHLHVGRVEGLAGLGDQEVPDLVVVRLHGVGELLEVRGTLVPGLGAPCWEGGTGSCHGLVDLLLA